MNSAPRIRHQVWSCSSFARRQVARAAAGLPPDLEPFAPRTDETAHQRIQWQLRTGYVLVLTLIWSALIILAASAIYSVWPPIVGLVCVSTGLATATFLADARCGDADRPVETNTAESSAPAKMYALPVPISWDRHRFAAWFYGLPLATAIAGGLFVGLLTSGAEVWPT